MKIGIMQPYFYPYIGYFQLINAVDTFVLYDDVTFIKGGWIHKNRIYERESFNYWGVNLKEVSSNKLIKDTELGFFDWNKLLKTIHQNYRPAPYFRPIWDILMDVAGMSGTDKINTISELNEFAIRYVCKYLRIGTKIIRSSEMGIPNIGRTERLVAICKELGGDTYINAVGGQELYTKEQFKKRGIDLFFLQTKEIRYKQFTDFFVSNLSIIDVLMFNSREKINESFLNNYTLL